MPATHPHTAPYLGSNAARLNPSAAIQSRLTTWVAVFLLLVLALQLILIARATSSTWDEAHHLFDGYNIWTRHDYGLNPEVPPLLKLVAAVPLLHAHLQVPVIQDRSIPKEAFVDGRAFVFGNGGDRVLFPARMACAVVTLVLGWLLFATTRSMFGAPAGLFALALYVFDPNFLANGALVTTDVGTACLLFAVVCAWYRYTSPSETSDANDSRPRWPWLLLTTVFTGLALAIKFTGVLALPVLAVLALYEATTYRSLKLLLRRVLALAFVAAISLVILWGFYGFRYEARPNGRPLGPPLAEYLKRLPVPSNAQHLSALARYHLLPEAYIWGLTNTKLTEQADNSYFFSHVYRHGNWMYFPAAFLIKSTLPLLILLALVPIALWLGYRRRHRELFFLLSPIVVYLAVAMHSDMNIGMRHILPIYPFLYALVSGATVTLVAKSRRWIPALALLLLWQAATSIRVFPGYMAYANEAWGGPSQVHRYLSDANSDWGQQLKEAKTYLDARHITNCWFAYFPDTAVEASDYGIDCKKLPNTDSLWWFNTPMDVPPVINGTVLISDGDLQGIEFGQGELNPYESFRHTQPTKLIQGGLWVFDGRFDVPLASALVQAQQAQNLLKAGDISAALTKAQNAVELAPNAVSVQAALADVLIAQGNIDDGLAHYQAAVHAAETIEPGLQADLLPGLRSRVKELQSKLPSVAANP